MIKIKLEQDCQNSDEYNKIINSKYSLEKCPFIEVKNCQDKNILNDDNYEGFIAFLNEINNSLNYHLFIRNQMLMVLIQKKMQKNFLRSLISFIL